MIFPLQYAVNAPIEVVGSLTEQLHSRHSLQLENARLREENVHLRSRSQKYAALAHQNERLRELLESSAELSETIVGADVLAIETSPSARQIVINKGSRQGVYLGQAVVDAFGVLGQVVHLGPFSSTALLITDLAHAMPVQINRTGLRAISTGSTGGDELNLTFVPTNADIKPNDLVVTSGLGNRFPPGYPVGKVSAVQIDPGEPFARIVVSPSAQVNRAREVLLVWPQPQNPIDDLEVSSAKLKTLP
ncbi:MAG: rod shape-determining protein MreC [Gammaproteobacteria bacterium]|jgi:rod shape-determining protein MreC